MADVSGTPTPGAPTLTGSPPGRSVGRLLAETGLSVGVGLAADGIFRSTVRSARNPTALIVGLVSAAGLKALGEVGLHVAFGDSSRSAGVAALDGVRTGLIDGALGIGSRRMHLSVVGRLPAGASRAVQTAASGVVLGGIGGSAYAATDRHTWARGATTGLVTVGQSLALGSLGGGLLGGATGFIAGRISPRRLTPAEASLPRVEEVPATTTNPTPKIGVETPAVSRSTKPLRSLTRPSNATSGTVVPGIAKTKGLSTSPAVSGKVNAALSEASQGIRGSNPAFKGDPYHPDVVKARIRQWQALYGKLETTAPVRMTRVEAAAAAEKLGFQPTNYASHGQPVFRKGNLYLTPDVDRHNGGVWKLAASVRELASKATRMGTYDAELNRIGD